MNRILMLASALALAGFSIGANAAEGSWFLRGEAGRSHETISASVPFPFFSNAGDNDSTWSLRGGYWLNRNFAVEGFYSNLYDQEVIQTFTREGHPAVFQVDLKFKAIGLGIVGKKNFGADGNGFFIDGRAGISRSTLEEMNEFFRARESSTKPYFGVGLGYDFNQNAGVSLNYDRLKGSGYNYDITSKTMTLGVEYRF